MPTPQACTEFGVDDVQTAGAELQAAGYRPLTPAGDEEVTRFVTPDGLVVVLNEEALAG